MSKLTREELLAGVVKVNNESVQYKGVKARDEGEVSGGRGGGEDPAPSGRDGVPAAEPGVLPQPKESLQTFVARRAVELVAELEEVSDRIERTEKDLASLKDERGTLLAEKKQLEKLSANPSSV